MRVREIWRYPVKSLQGERLDSVEAGPAGLFGDRQYAIFDRATGFGLTARREPELLFASARLRDDGTPEIRLPDGSVAADDTGLSTWVGRPVTLRSTGSGHAPAYEGVADFEHEAPSTWTTWTGPDRSFHDSGEAAVSFVSQASIGSWAPRRFRANLLLDGSGEDTLVGCKVRVGKAVLDVTESIPRCVMTTRPQPEGIERDLDVLRSIHREHAGLLAVGALVVAAGRVAVGDEIEPIEDGLDWSAHAGRVRP